jgi:hypothetical protein
MSALRWVAKTGEQAVRAAFAPNRLLPSGLSLAGWTRLMKRG